ncbi:hypothetical protein CHH77_00470 [Shouchella clausii]|nr:hypothetical protein CHH77_00470 [Shouchella clausii]PAF10277.1 hypothetical protein CHH65_04850 [Shouchella clausii]
MVEGGENVSKTKLATIGVGSILLLTACGENATETIYDHLENAAQIEKEGFEVQQEPLVQAEEHEADLYNQIMELDMEQFEEIVSLADEAIASIETRRELSANEKQSIEEGYEEFSAANEAFAALEEEPLAELGQTLKEAMEARYESYQKLHEVYAETLDLDEQLYNLLKTEDLDVETLTNQVEETNAKYEEFQEATDLFNEHTNIYNDAKQAFYEASDLDVRFE